MKPRSVDYRMDFYVKDFIASTETMTGPEAAAYSLLLIHGWAHGASLPADPERIRRICRFDPRDWRRVWPALEPKWPLTADGTARRNPREVERWSEATARAAKATEHGKQGAAGRWTGDSPEPPPDGARVVPEDCPSNARTLLEQCGPRTTSSSSSSEKSKDGEGAPTSGTPPPPLFFPSKGNTEPLSKWSLTLKGGKLWPIPESCVDPFRSKLSDDTIRKELDKLVRRTAAEPVDAKHARARVAGWLESQVTREAAKAPDPDHGRRRVGSLAELWTPEMQRQEDEVRARREREGPRT